MGERNHVVIEEVLPIITGARVIAGPFSANIIDVAQMAGAIVVALANGRGGIIFEDGTWEEFEIEDGI